MRHPHDDLISLFGPQAPDVLVERREGRFARRAPHAGGEREEQGLRVQEGPVAEGHPVFLAVAEEDPAGGCRVPAGDETGRVAHGPRAVHVDERVDHFERLGFRLGHQILGGDSQVAGVEVMDVGVAGHPATLPEVGEAFEFRLDESLLAGTDRDLTFPRPELDPPLEPDGRRARG